MSPPTVVLDANVLFPAPVRDLFIRLAIAGVVRAHWTEQILEETFRNILRVRPELDPSSLERTRQLMNRAVRDVMVVGDRQPASRQRRFGAAGRRVEESADVGGDTSSGADEQRDDEVNGLARRALSGMNTVESYRRWSAANGPYRLTRPR